MATTKTLREKLDEFFRKKKGAIPVGAPLKPMGAEGAFPLIDAFDVVVDILDYDTPNEKVVTLGEKLQGLGTGGGQGVGISKIAYIDSTEKETGDVYDNYKITFTDSEMEAFGFSIKQGKTPVKGVDYKDGVGIDSIEYKRQLTTADGIFSEYEITFTDPEKEPFRFSIKQGTSGGSVTIEYESTTESITIK